MSEKVQSRLCAAVVCNKFGVLPDGQQAHLYCLSNSSGMSVKISDYGAIITEILIPDENGKQLNVALGFDNLEQYLAKHPRFGCTIGRYANRIGNASFTLDGVNYKLAVNNGKNSIHGGLVGFDKQKWETLESGESEEGSRLKLRLLSEDMQEGFPGNLDLKVEFSVLNNNSLQINYEAVSDRATPLNLTNHSYFNLKGAGQGEVLDHICQFNAAFYTPLDSESIPTGEITSVENTPYDFRNPASIRSKIDGTGSGYDINLVAGSESAAESLIHTAGADPAALPAIRKVAEVHEPGSGRKMLVYSDQPGFQFFTANSLDGSISGNGGSYVKHAGFCIETQHFADSVHHKNFPNVILRPGQIFRSSTRYVFEV